MTAERHIQALQDSLTDGVIAQRWNHLLDNLGTADEIMLDHAKAFTEADGSMSAISANKADLRFFEDACAIAIAREAPEMRTAERMEKAFKTWRLNDEQREFLLSLIGVQHA